MPRSLPPLLTLAAVLLIWEVAVRSFGVPQYLLPAPTEIFNALVGRFDYLFENAQVTAISTILGFALSITVGVPIAVLLVASKLFERSVYPLLLASQTIPKIAIAPLFLVWFGFGMLPKVLMASLIAFFPVAISTVVGLQSAEPEMIQLLRSMGGSRIQEFTKVRFPNALPVIFGGVKVAITLSVVGTVVGEFVGSNAGLGYVLLIATGVIDTPLLFAAISFLVLFGVILFYSVNLLELRMTHWYQRSGANVAANVETA